MANHPPATALQPSKKRPFIVTILIVMVLIFTTLNTLRVISAIASWTFLTKSPVDVPISYFAATGAFWSLTGLILALGLFFAQRWSLRLAQILILLYVVYYWLDRLWIAEPSAIAVRWPFALVFTLFIVIYTFLVLSRPKVKQFLSK